MNWYVLILRRFTMIPGAITCMDWSPNSQILLVGCSNGLIMEISRPGNRSSVSLESFMTFTIAFVIGDCDVGMSIPVLNCTQFCRIFDTPSGFEKYTWTKAQSSMLQIPVMIQQSHLNWKTWLQQFSVSNVQLFQRKSHLSHQLLPLLPHHLPKRWVPSSAIYEYLMHLSLIHKHWSLFDLKLQEIWSLDSRFYSMHLFSELPILDISWKSFPRL